MTTDYVCPNGHVFPGALTVPCDECGAAVVCEPIAAGMRLHEALETIEGDLAALSGALKGAAAALELAGSKASAGAARDALRQYGGQ
jgi:hypothetical protein